MYAASMLVVVGMAVYAETSGDGDAGKTGGCLAAASVSMYLAGIALVGRVVWFTTETDAAVVPTAKRE